MAHTTAIVFHGANDARLGTVALEEPAEDEVQVRTIASLVSIGTERWILTDRFARNGTPFPCIPGYQRVGIVAKVGSNVKDVRIGERVIATSGSWRGNEASYWGAHAAVGNTPRSEIYAVPDRVGDADAAGIVVAQVGVHAASRVVLDGDDWVVVYGDGLIGQCASQAARARGARTILIGRRPARLELGARHSADSVLDARQGNLRERVMRITGGRAVTAVLDTVQNEAIQREYVPMLRPGEGQIVYCGHSLDKAWADMPMLQARGATCHFISDWTRERVETTIGLMAEGAIRLAPLITHRASGAEAPGLYAMLLENTESYLGLLIDWSGAE